MRNMMIASIAVLLAIGLGSSQLDASEECHIGDASLCLAAPNCHWDYSQRGCVAGPAKQQDACVAHEDPNVCNTNKTLNCGWNDAAKKCETKSR
ncbi:MAG: hypothetical protein ACOYB4_04345 [Methyloceanibacter sp.]